MPKRVKRPKKTNSRQTAFSRFMLIVAVLLIWMGGIGVRLVHLQVTKHEWLKERAESQRFDIQRSKLPRGAIFDRNGRALAMSVRVKTLYADPTEIDDIKSVAKTLSKVTGLKEKAITDQLSSGKEDERRFVPLLKGLDEETVDRLNKALDEPTVKKADSPRFAGLHYREDQRRTYPYGSMAAHVVGFSNAEGVGQAGIEQSQNEVLYGAVFKKILERDRLGRVYDENISEKEPPKDVVLTISTPIQFMTPVQAHKAAEIARTEKKVTSESVAGLTRTAFQRPVGTSIVKAELTATARNEKPEPKAEGVRPRIVKPDVTAVAKFR